MQEEMMTDGELWARELLEGLRGSRFTPLAWIRFLRASFVRANVRRRQRPRAFREMLALSATGFAVWALVGWLFDPTLALAGGLFWLVNMLMLDWHLGMLERPDGTPIRGLGAANVIDLCRLGAVPALAVLSPGWLVFALLVIGTLDVVDGRLARSRNEVTRLGQWLDGSVDTIVLITGAWLLVRADALPVWAGVLVSVRYLTPLVVITIWYFLAAAPPPRHGYVPGRYPGVVLLAGLLLAPFWEAGAIALVALGALSGLATFLATVMRSACPDPD
jgi:phosphatidylglycerophosphate synthase